MYVQNVTLFTRANRKFLILLVRLTSSINVLVTNLSFKIRHMMFTKKDAIQRLFLRPGIGPDRYSLLQYLHFHHPWRSYVARSQGRRCDKHPKTIQKANRVIRLALITFTVILSPTSPSQASTSCPSTQFDEISQVRYIHDGDTLHLNDGRKVRLIGINTPEVAHDNRPAEPFAVEAKNTLRSLFKHDKSITLVFGKDRKDHYGRFLAHAFLPDGTNVQAVILQHGFASVIAIPPNTRFSSCYLDIERSARCNKTGLWKNTDVLETKDLKKHHKGFHLIKGTVQAIKTDSKGIWLNLDNKLTIGIRKKNQTLFDLKWVNNMLNQTIIVRGWLNKSKKSTPFYLRVRHPLSIQLSSSFTCQ